jgi:hypothetical protein
MIKKDYQMLILWVFLIGIILPVMLYFRIRTDLGFYGDQVHFLVMTQSLIEDGDLNVKNQYEQESYWEYFRQTDRTSIEPHLSKNKFNDQSPAWYSIHNPGLPILLVPGFLLAGANGAAFTMVVIDFIVLFLLWLWVYQLTKSRGGAFLAMFVLFCSPFFLGQVGYIFTDMPSLAIILGCLILLIKKKQSWHYLLLSVLFGVGVWIHIKLALILITIGVIALMQLYYDKDKSVKTIKFIALILPVVLIFVLFEWKMWQWYQEILPFKPFAANQMFSTNPVSTLSAWLFDRAQGLLILNPVFWLLPIGLPIWYQSRQKSLFYLAISILPTFMMILTFDDWCGGYSPSGRYIITFAPLLLPAIGYLYIRSRNNFLIISAVILSFLQSLYAFILIYYKNVWTLSGERSEIFLTLEKKTGIAFDYLIPNFDGSLHLVFPAQIYSLICLFVILFVLIGYGVYLARYSSYKKNTPKTKLTTQSN